MSSPARPDRVPDTDLLVYPGRSLKMVDAGDGDAPLVLEGYLVVFTDETRPDKSAARDFFTPETNLGLLSDLGEVVVPSLYDHGIHGEIADEHLGTATLKADDVGVFARHEIRRRKAYLRRLAEEAEEEGVGLGQSSGAWPRGVRREPRKGGTHWLARWPIWEASITPTPAEPLTGAAVKSLAAAPDWGALVAALQAEHEGLRIARALREARLTL